uniref:NADH dehydrogenase subunit 2 n=1 Tax=Procletes levicarina TaxID=2529268 RepID=UPI00286C098E|nr:NADH dehydrogenase subunit 2 [Procletes levicarina]WKF54313.1 NADH dehydrogenase subunit 2 [Procletes levicarina]
MMTLHPARVLFMSTLLLGAFIAVSSSSWFTGWLGLELNLLSFIPLISSKSNIYSSEAALKYFLIQALGSSIILASAPGLISFKSALLMILCALLLKMGAAPVHFWFPSVMQGIGWLQCVMLMTIQKIAPMLMLSYLVSSDTMIVPISSMLSSLVGSLGGLNQTLMRKIMSYSSINHMGWMLAAMYISTPMWTNYFMIYMIVTSTVVSIMHSQQIFHFSQTSSTSHRSTLTKIMMFFSMLSLGGLPPFLGFLPKMMVIKSLVSSNALMWLAILLFSALITLFYYLRIIMTSLTLTSPKMKTSPTLPMNSISMSMSFINLIPLICPLMALLPF